MYWQHGLFGIAVNFYPTAGTFTRRSRFTRIAGRRTDDKNFDSRMDEHASMALNQHDCAMRPFLVDFRPAQGDAHHSPV
jgi:hypothetical protein